LRLSKELSMMRTVRFAALALVVFGTSAATRSFAASSATVVSPRLGALPVPTCPPDDANGCGIRQLGH
jgi:hypothetical protein